MGTLLDITQEQGGLLVTQEVHQIQVEVGEDTGEAGDRQVATLGAATPADTQEVTPVALQGEAEVGDPQVEEGVRAGQVGMAEEDRRPEDTRRLAEGVHQVVEDPQEVTLPGVEAPQGDRVIPRVEGHQEDSLQGAEAHQGDQVIPRVGDNITRWMVS